MVKFVRPTIKRRYVFAALFVYGVVYMLAQLLSPREVDGDARRKSHVSSAAPNVTSRTSRPAVAAPAQLPLPKHRVRGVSPDEVKHYTPGKTFKCLHSSGVISYDQVNDDYCDCKDGSDEPGTSACPNGRFYCERHSARSPKYILSMRVNDGICDCCDGSDEWSGAVLPSNLLLSDEQQARAGVYQAPCKVRC
uniref:Protein kinase C substrate 80K-H n=1 Tax=Rhipicephalus appendiculatus TaxID=34631 RepID=A0A131YV01_RHIAP